MCILVAAQLRLSFTGLSHCPSSISHRQQPLSAVSGQDLLLRTSGLAGLCGAPLSTMTFLLGA